MFAFIIIFQLMGGLFTPIGSMPEWAQDITYAVPPRFFNEIMRSIYLKGTSIFELRSQFLWLAAYAVLSISCAAFTYRKRALGGYVILDFYNTQRPHMSIGMQTPDQAHRQSGEQKRCWKNCYAMG